MTNRDIKTRNLREGTTGHSMQLLRGRPPLSSLLAFLSLLHSTSWKKLLPYLCILSTPCPRWTWRSISSAMQTAAFQQDALRAVQSEPQQPVSIGPVASASQKRFEPVGRCVRKEGTTRHRPVFRGLPGPEPLLPPFILSIHTKHHSHRHLRLLCNKPLSVTALQWRSSFTPFSNIENNNFTPAGFYDG